MKKFYPYIIGFVVVSWALMACKKDEVTISTEEKMLTAHTWTVSEFYVNDSLRNTPSILASARIKFNATSTINVGTIYMNGTPSSYWKFDPATNSKIILNPDVSGMGIPAEISKLENTSLGLKFRVTVPFLGVTLEPNTEIRMVPAQ